MLSRNAGGTGLLSIFTPEPGPSFTSIRNSPGCSSSAPGLFVHTGYSAYGLTMGLAGGEMLADLMTGQPPKVDPSPFRLGRFAKGETIVPRL